nr:reverse transcriptase domain-containing protein [Tanacetum cinerariifolium]
MIVREGTRLRRTIMEFEIVCAASPYNKLLGRLGISILEAVPSTIHAMFKFPTPRRVTTIITQLFMIVECQRATIKGKVSQSHGKIELEMIVREGTRLRRTIMEFEIIRRLKIKLEGTLEAYMDDMVIKSHDEKGLLPEIEETFKTLRKINMKLNPKKCSFGMEEGKFLSLAQQGNPNMQSESLTITVAQQGSHDVYMEIDVEGNDWENEGDVWTLFTVGSSNKDEAGARWWIKAKPLAKISGKDMKKFIWENIVCSGPSSSKWSGGTSKQEPRGRFENKGRKG